MQTLKTRLDLKAPPGFGVVVPPVFVFSCCKEGTLAGFPAAIEDGYGLKVVNFVVLLVLVGLVAACAVPGAVCWGCTCWSCWGLNSTVETSWLISVGKK